MKVNGYVVPDAITVELKRWIETHRPTQKELVAQIRVIADRSARLWKLRVLAPHAASRLLKAKPAEGGENAAP